MSFYSAHFWDAEGEGRGDAFHSGGGKRKEMGRKWKDGREGGREGRGKDEEEGGGEGNGLGREKGGEKREQGRGIGVVHR